MMRTQPIARNTSASRSARRSRNVSRGEGADAGAGKNGAGGAAGWTLGFFFDRTFYYMKGIASRPQRHVPRDAEDLFPRMLRLHARAELPRFRLIVWVSDQ